MTKPKTILAYDHPTLWVQLTSAVLLPIGSIIEWKYNAPILALLFMWSGGLAFGGSIWAYRANKAEANGV